MPSPDQPTGSTGALEPIFVSIKDAAAMLSLTPWSVRQLLDAKVIESTYHGRRRLVVLTSVRDYANSLRAHSGEAS